MTAVQAQRLTHTDVSDLQMILDDFQNLEINQNIVISSASVTTEDGTPVTIHRAETGKTSSHFEVEVA